MRDTENVGYFGVWWLNSRLRIPDSACAVSGGSDGAIRDQRANRHPVRDGGKGVARRPVIDGFAGEAMRLDKCGDDAGQVFVARHGLENFTAGDRVGSSASTGIDRNGIDNFSVNFCFETAEADVRSFVIAASGGQPDQWMVSGVPCEPSFSFSAWERATARLFVSISAMLQ